MSSDSAVESNLDPSLYKIDPASRFQLRGIGELMHPGCCMVCGNGTRVEGYVDLGVYIDYEGQFYICVLCAEELTGIIGSLTQAEAKIMHGHNTQLAEENTRLKEELETSNGRLIHYDSVIAGAFEPIADNVYGSTPDASVEESESSSAVGDESGTDVTDTSSSGNRKNPKSVKSVKKSGHSDISRSEQDNPELPDGFSL